VKVGLLFCGSCEPGDVFGESLV